MPINLPHYYDRFDATDHYERHLFRAGNVLQAAELNEVQSASMHRLQRVTDALFKEGDVLSGADIIVDLYSGATTITGGALYLRGAVRGVPAGALTVPTTGQVTVGVYLTETVITEVEDPNLRDPAISFRNYQDPGAARLQITGVWGYEGDGQTGDFYPVYHIEDGLLIGKTPPPQVDAVAQAIARYDRQSAGGYYVSAGMMVSRLADGAQGEQVYSMAAGVARVGGEEIVRQHARRVVYATQPTTRAVVNESHPASGGTETVASYFTPLHTATAVSVVRQATTVITHGVSGSLDEVVDGGVVRTSVTAIVSITLANAPFTEYVAGQDYQLTASRVDWSLAGAEPGAGESYTLVYQYRDTYVPEAWTTTGVTVSGAVPGTEILLSYAWALPRFDLICLDMLGEIRVVTGIAATRQPRIPPVPSGMLGVAVLDQRWDERFRLINNAPRMVPMNELNYLGRRIDTLFALVAEERLALDLTQRDLPAKKGVLADPFRDEDFRDQGLVQTAAILAGDLTLGVAATVFEQTLAAPGMLTPTDATAVIDQPLRTGSMLVNPYDSFAPLPGTATLAPAQDFWVVNNTTWTSGITREFEGADYVNDPYRRREMLIKFGKITGKETEEELIALGYLVVRTETRTRSETEVVSSAAGSVQTLRPIWITFTLTGFGPGEILQTVTFDGLSVTPQAL